MASSNLTEPLEANAAFAASNAHTNVPEIPFIPFKQLYVITCIDPRVEPAAILGLGLGDAIVARCVGGRITQGVINDMAWIVELHRDKTPDADWFEVAIIHHTDCGSGLMADDDLRASYVERGAWTDAECLQMAVLDPHETVRDDVAKLRAATELVPGIENVRIGGYAYDLATGLLTTVVAPT